MASGLTHLLSAPEVACVATVMVVAGLRTRVLEHRLLRRRCPACGRDTRDCRCGA